MQHAATRRRPRAPATNFSVAAREARHPAAQQRRRAWPRRARSRRAAPGRTRPYGVDGTFAFFAQPGVQHATGRRRGSRGLDGDDTSYRAQLDYAGDRYGVQLERLVVGDNFNPGGRLRAPRRHPRELRPVPLQPAAGVDRESVRKFSGIGTFTYIEDGAGLPARRGSPTASSPIEFQNSDRFSVGVDRQLRVADAAVRHRAGGVESRSAATTSHGARAGVHASASSGRSRAAVAVEHGGFYDGDRTSVSVQPHPRQPDAALLARAERVDQLDRSARRARSPRRSSGRASPTR